MSPQADRKRSVSREPTGWLGSALRAGGLWWLLLSMIVGLSMVIGAPTANAQTGSGPTTGQRAGNSQAGSPQAGSPQAGNSQAGSSQAGSSQAGNPQAGNSQAGRSQPGAAPSGNPQAGGSPPGNAQTARRKADEFGIVVNQSFTLGGQEFYRRFTDFWREKPDFEVYTLVVNERPSRRFGNRISVTFGQQVVFAGVLPVRVDGIRALALDGVEKAYATIISLNIKIAGERDVDMASDDEI